MTTMLRFAYFVIILLAYFKLETMALSPSSTDSVSNAAAESFKPAIRPLPETILLGYASRCDYQQVKRAVKQGVNVVAWAFLKMPHNYNWDEAAAAAACRRTDSGNDEGSATTTTTSDCAATVALLPPDVDVGLDIPCIHQLIQTLDNDGYNDVVHITSLGGWNGAHLDPNLSASAWYDQWKKWCGATFHGLDWDLEGNDDLESPTNVFTKDCLDKMGEISRLAKEDGYIVSMAPAQSYLDMSRSIFSRYVNLTDPTRGWHDDFSYFGANVYAYILARYGNYIDLISMQFYESYSQAAYAIRHQGMTSSDYLEQYIRTLKSAKEEFLVEFAQDPTVELPSQAVQMPLSKLLLGFANGWAHDSPKAVFITPLEVQAAYNSLTASNHELPRGLMFWLIDEEGNHDIIVTPGFNEILHIRPPEPSDADISS